MVVRIMPFYVLTILTLLMAYAMFDRLPGWLLLVIYANALLAAGLFTRRLVRRLLRL